MSSNIASLYVATARLIFESNISNPSSWAYEVANLFPGLHNTLKCCSCHSLLVDPQSPKSLCRHHVCKTCIGKEKQLAVPCALCSSSENYVENEELALLLVCYNKLCSYIRQSETLLKYLSECGGDADLMNILLEGESYLCPPPQQPPPDAPHSTGSYPIAFAHSPIPRTSNPNFSNHPAPGANNPTFSNHPVPGANAVYSTSLSSAPIPGPGSAFSQSPLTGSSYPSSPVHRTRKTFAAQCNGSAVPVDNSPQPIYSVLLANEGNKITIKRKVPDEYNMSAVNNRITAPVKSKSSGQKSSSSKSGPSSGSSKSGASSGGCRCGLATAAPGKLTCCGQRCLCYTEQRPCRGCKCRGCRNPHTAHGKKKLRGLEEYQMSLSQNQSPGDEFLEENHEDTTVKIVGINSSNNNFQVIQFVDQES